MGLKGEVRMYDAIVTLQYRDKEYKMKVELGDEFETQNEDIRKINALRDSLHRTLIWLTPGRGIDSADIEVKNYD